jgi:hypothetical protein
LVDAARNDLDCIIPAVAVAMLSTPHSTPIELPEPDDIRLVRLKYTSVVRTDIIVAFTGPSSYLFDILDVDATAAVHNHSGPMQLACHLRHAGTAHPHHLR